MMKFKVSSRRFRKMLIMNIGMLFFVSLISFFLLFFGAKVFSKTIIIYIILLIVILSLVLLLSYELLYLPIVNKDIEYAVNDSSITIKAKKYNVTIEKKQLYNFSISYKKNEIKRIVLHTYNNKYNISLLSRYDLISFYRCIRRFFNENS